jgi:hypothetical protein
VNVLSVKPGHDGTIAFISDGRLVFCLEAEKHSFPRYSDVTAQLLVDAMTMAPAVPDVLAISGWHKIIPGFDEDLGAGYSGTFPGQLREGKIFGRRVALFSSSHERSHSRRCRDAPRSSAARVRRAFVGGPTRRVLSLDRRRCLDPPHTGDDRARRALERAIRARRSDLSSLR